MKRAPLSHDSAMISRLFFRLLPVQAAIIAMGSINSIVDGIVAARFIDAATVGVIGLYFTVLRILEAVSAILVSGVSVLSGRSLGAGDVERTRGICSLGFTVALLVGAAMTLAGLLAPGLIAELLGAKRALRDDLLTYVIGNAIGIVPNLLSQQLTLNLQMERQDRLGQIGIFVMIAVNVTLDMLFVGVLDMGIWGLALATSLANWAYFLVLVSYYFTGKAQLTPNPARALWDVLPDLLKTGFPNGLLVGCLAAKSLVLNRILITYSGQDSLSALAAYNMANAFLLSIALGSGAVVRMLSSILFGEENREGLLALCRVVMTRVMAVILIITGAVVLLSPYLARIYFPDTASATFEMTRQLFVIQGACLPVMYTCIVYSGYYQATERRLFMTLISVTDGFLSVVIPALILAPRLGALGVWLATPIGGAITLTLCVLYPAFQLRRWPRGADEWLLLPARFGEGERLVLTLRSMDEVTLTADKVQSFCAAHGVQPRNAHCAGLCLEEMAGNIVRHGFRADRHSHIIELCVLIQTGGGVMLRIKDDCAPFNPQEWHDMAHSDDPGRNMGIRLVYGLADRVEYQNLLGLNVLTVLLAG